MTSLGRNVKCVIDSNISALFIMSKSTPAVMKKDNGTSLKCVLENFERTIYENNRVGVNSGMYLTTNVCMNHSSGASINKSRRKDQRNDGRKTMSNVSILATLDEMTDLRDAIDCFDSKSMDYSLHKNILGKDKPVTATEDADEMSISSFHSGSRRASSIISRPISISSDTEGGGCGGSTASSRSKNSVVARPSARIRELPRDIQIRSCDYDTTDDDNSDSDSDDEEDEHATPIKSRYW
jgi:hypothetical protein